MCQACYEKGFKDYPNYNTSVAHIEDYKRGYKTRQNESMDADELQHTFFCEKCYERGLNNSKIGIWSPPLSTKRGHYESYEKGYNQVEMEEANKIPEYYLPEDETAKTEPPRKVNWNLYFIAGAALVVVIIAGVVISRFMHASSGTTSADSAIVSAPPVVTDTAPKIQATEPTEKPVTTAQEQPKPQAAAPAPEPPKPAPAAAPIEKVTKVEKPKEQAPKPVEVKKPAPEKVAISPKKEEPPVSKARTSEPVVVSGNRVLTEGELKGINKQDLKLMRNEIFARHGYIFKSPELNNYFRQKPWYKPQHEDVNGLLSPEERQNVELIKKMER